jgi:hypothetical protein
VSTSRVFMPLGRWMLSAEYQHPLSRAEKKALGIPQHARSRRPSVVLTLRTEVDSIVATVYEARPGVWRADFSHKPGWSLERSSSMAARVAAERVCRALVAEHRAFWSAFGGASTRGAA